MSALRLLVGACFAICVTAGDDGDDFSNNLFTDLTPLLSLFGERVTTQFMSQSTGWADNIILAMAPLGIMTIIVSAIRVGGPSWLKAIIGRARENHAVAESELMSSTSHEVCELWNGQQIVRVMGEGPIREFIILSPEGNGDDGGKGNAQETAHAQATMSGRRSDSQSARSGTEGHSESKTEAPTDPTCRPPEGFYDESDDSGTESDSESAIGGTEGDSLTTKTDEKTLVMDLRSAKSQEYMMDCNPTFRERLFGRLSQKHENPLKPEAPGPEERESGDAHQPVHASQSRPSLRERIFGRRVLQGQDPENATPDLNKRQVPGESNVEGLGAVHTSVVCDSNVENQGTGLPSATSDSNVENQGASRRSVIVVRNRDVHSPNLILNIHNRISKGGLYSVAVIGLVSQLGILVYFGIAAKYLTRTLLKDGKPVADYAFPCTVVGTVLVVIGTLICAHVVESSTSEMRYRPADGMNARVVWLQRSGTVNDQAFESFAVFPEDAQELVMTSTRASRRRIKDMWRIHILRELGKPKPPKETTSKLHSRKGALELFLETEVEEVMTVAGTSLGICGFVVQFVGLRGMHWSASVAQLGAIVLMTVLRAAIRRNLAKSPQSQPLLSGHELDWLALTLSDLKIAPWRDPPANGGKRDKYDRPWADGNGWDWKVAAVEVVKEPPELPELHLDNAGSEDSESAESEGQLDAARAEKDGTTQPEQPLDNAGAETDGSTELLQEGESHETRQTQNPSVQGGISRPHARSVMTIRRDLGELADWPGLASAEAISLARAIEVTMDALFDDPPESMGGVFTWSLGTIQSSSRCEPILFHVKLHNGKWKAYSDELEAALSLWLYSVHEEENSVQRVKAVERKGPLDTRGTRESDSGESLGTNNDLQGISNATETRDTDGEETPKDDAWLRAKGTQAKPSLRLLGPYTASLLRDLQWWIPDGAPMVIKVYNSESNTHKSMIEVDPHRVVGFASRSITGAPLCLYEQGTWEIRHSNIHLAVKSYSPLKTLYAQQMFSVFMAAAAKAMSPMFRKAVVQPAKTDDPSGQSWQSFTLRDSLLSRIVQDIQSTGLGSSEDVLLSIIPSLSTEMKLPQLDAIVEWTQEHAEPYKRRGNWREASDAYLWLFREATTFPRQDNITLKATAVLVENIMALDNYIELREAQQGENAKVESLKTLRQGLQMELQHAAVDDILSALELLYKHHDRGVETQLGEYPEDLTANYLVLNSIRLPCGIFGMQTYANERDILDWTRLHYAAMNVKKIHDLEKLLEPGVDVNARDLCGQTPLHLACRHGNISFVHQLLQNGAGINMQDTNGTVPLHRAVSHGHDDVTQLLIEAGADMNVADGLGCTPLHVAVISGSEALVKLLKDASVDIRDHFGRTALHISVVAEEGAAINLDVVRCLVDHVKANLETKNMEGWTPLHLAVDGGHEDIIRYLVKEARANKEATDTTGRTPLHVAIDNNNEGVIRYLIEGAEANKEATDITGRTPLHAAIDNDQGDIIRYLIKEAKANKEATDITGRTPLHIAIDNNKADIIKYLVEEAKVDIESTDQTGLTPLQLAVTNGRGNIVKYLIEEAKADKEATDPTGLALIHIAAQMDDHSVVTILLEAGADKNTKTRKGSTPLHFATKYRSEQVVRCLIDAKADVDAKDRNDRTPLHIAANRGSADAVEWLLENKADKEARDVKGQTPLHVAAENHNIRAVRHLLDAGANKEARDAMGWTPLHVAALYDRDISVLLLIKDGADMEARDQVGRTPLHLASKYGGERVVVLLIESKAEWGVEDRWGRTPFDLAVEKDRPVAELLRSRS